MGKIVTAGRNQVEVYFRDASNSPHRIWYPKDSLTLMAKGSQLTPQALPSGLENEVGPVQPLHSAVGDEKVPPTNEWWNLGIFYVRMVLTIKMLGLSRTWHMILKGDKIGWSDSERVTIKKSYLNCHLRIICWLNFIGIFLFLKRKISEYL